MKVHGSCYCGKVTYEAEADPEKTVICHCTDCQAMSGTAYRTVTFVSSSTFKLTGAAPKTFIKIAESGNKREMAFCPDCGSHIYATDPGPQEKVMGLRVGTLKERADFVPKKQAWVKSAMPWVQDISDLEKVG